MIVASYMKRVTLGAFAFLVASSGAVLASEGDILSRAHEIKKSVGKQVGEKDKKLVSELLENPEFKKVFPELMEKVHAFLWERVKSRDLRPLDENEQKKLQDCAVCANLYFDFQAYDEKVQKLYGEMFQGLAGHLNVGGMIFMPAFWDFKKELIKFQNQSNDQKFFVDLFSRISVAQNMYAMYEIGVDPNLK